MEYSIEECLNKVEKITEHLGGGLTTYQKIDLALKIQGNEELNRIHKMFDSENEESVFCYINDNIHSFTKNHE